MVCYHTVGPQFEEIREIDLKLVLYMKMHLYMHFCITLTYVVHAHTHILPHPQTQFLKYQVSKAYLSLKLIEKFQTIQIGCHS